MTKEAFPLDRIVITDELKKRPSREPNYAAENTALREISRNLAVSADAALHELCEQAVRLCGAHSAGVSIAETEGEREIFRWHAVVGKLSPFLRGTMPREFSPCGFVTRTGEAQLMEDMVRHYEYVDELGTYLHEVLLVPFHQDGKATGTIWAVSHSKDKIFDGEDLRLLTTLAEFTSGVVQSYLKSRELESTREQLQQVVNVAHVGFFDWDITTDRIVFSEQMQKDWGFEAGTTLEKVIALIHPDDYEATAKKIQRAMEDLSSYSTQYRVIRPSDGNTVWIEAKGKVVPDDRGKASRFFGTSVNITELALARLAVEESERRLRSALVNGKMGSWMIRFPGGELEADEQFRAFHNANETEDIQAAVTRIGHPEDQPRVREGLENAINHGTPYDCEYRIIDSDGAIRWVHARGAPAYDAGGVLQSISGVAYDIDSRKRAEFALEEAKKHSEKVNVELKSEREVRERFVAALSHDLRTPLSVARLSAQLLKRKLGDPDSSNPLFDRMIQSLDRLDGMVKDLLDANRIKAGDGIPIETSECYLDEIVEHALSSLAETEHEIRVVKPRSQIRGMWDGKALRRVVENLVGNAIKYGAIDTPVTVTISEKEDGAELAVHNEGNPIPLETQAALFSQYHRAQSADSSGLIGWGIGLTLVQGIATAHGGAVTLQSDAKDGTTFTVVLPRMR